MWLMNKSSFIQSICTSERREETDAGIVVSTDMPLITQRPDPHLSSFERWVWRFPWIMVKWFPQWKLILQLEERWRGELVFYFFLMYFTMYTITNSTDAFIKCVFIYVMSTSSPKMGLVSNHLLGLGVRTGVIPPINQSPVLRLLPVPWHTPPLQQILSVERGQSSDQHISKINWYTSK